MEPTLLDKIPPQSMEAEQATLGSMLLERDAIARVVTILDPADFYRDTHRMLYEGMLELFNRGVPVDLVTLGEYLRDHQQLERVGGVTYLTELLESVPTTANVEQYAHRVRGKAILRNLIQAAHQVVGLASDPARDVDEVVDESERLVFGVAERTVSNAFTPLKPLIGEAYDRMEQLSKPGAVGTGLSTGFPEIDQITSGLQPSNLVILAARPSMGKTALALNVAVHVAMHEKRPVAVFSLEMAKEELAMRVLCAEARVDQHAWHTGFLNDTDVERVLHATERLYDVPIYIDDTATLSVLEMRGKARRLQAELGDLGLIVLDYLQLMTGHGRFENRTQEISGIARGLKSLARELRVPLVALSQLSRAVESRQPRRPLLSDLRESGSIEAEADVVAFIYRPGYYGPEEMERAEYPADDVTVTEIHVAKQRNGPVGTARLAWIGSHVRFEQRVEYRVADDVGG